MIVPLVTAPDADYPLRSQYLTLFEALGHAKNAPVVMGLYRLVPQAAPGVGYSVIAGLVAVLGAVFGFLGIQFAKFKDQLY